MSDNQQPGNWQNPQGGWQQQPNPQRPHGSQGPQQGPPPGYQGPGPQQGPPPGYQGPGPQQGPPPGYQGQQPYAPQAQQYGAAPQGPYGPQGGAPTKKKSKVPAIIAGVVALAVVVGGGVLAFSLLGGSTPAAAKGIPGDALAVMEINLNPAAGDKLAVKEFAEKFPDLQGQVDDVDGDYKKALWNLIPESADKPDYDADVKPWLGDSVAVAAVGDPSNPDVVASIQVTDKGRAEAFAAEHMDGSQVDFIDDLMIVSETDAPADIDAIRAGSLADSETYAADLAKLGGSWLATGWVGEELIRAGVEDAGQGMGVNPADVSGRVAAGIRIEDGAATLKAVVASNEDIARADVDDDFIKSLPAAGLGALSFGFSDDAIDMVWEQLQSLEASAPGMLSQVGIASTDDLRAVLGKQLAATVSFQGEMPAIGLKVRTEDPAKHQQVLETLLASLGLPGIQHQTDGDVVYTTFGMTPDELANPAAKLGDNEAFKQLTATSGDAESVIWIDVPAIVAMPELGIPTDDEVFRNLAPLSGIGISGSTIGDGYQEVFIRVGTK